MDNKIFFVAIEIYYQKLNFIAIKNFVPIKLFSFLVVRQKKKKKKRGKILMWQNLGFLSFPRAQSTLLLLSPYSIVKDVKILIWHFMCDDSQKIKNKIK